ncbi:phosphatidate cytidylyltransferase, partial [Arthrobacter deserti]|nr:phosphatidate cytidylyltransferase [Arthrobacter deserti]
MSEDPPSIRARRRHGAGPGSVPSEAGSRGGHRTSQPSRAGRNLPAAIGVGVGLLVIVLVGLFFMPSAFVALIAAFAVLGSWEVSRALTVKDIHAPQPPLYAGAAVMPFAAFYGGLEALCFALVAPAVAILVYACLEPARNAARRVMSGVFVLAWVPLFISFALLLLDEPNGAFKVATMLLLVVANDTFGYLVGVLFGRHPMAPKISPKKSWEGFAGS